ncbi:hypothetical protein [Paraburkholderia sp. RAU2J]|uniref:hypothetical protein n=1 Tax=Paraburkholderia sp. RAU2J TaxID=1938810 RepID=UPI0011C36B5D|nr:hypothetical protein [Paraburkholderia sp. RAU2J]
MTSLICGVARETGARVKQEMLHPGTAPNKLLAKIGSELYKPERLAFLTSHDLACRYSPWFLDLATLCVLALEPER